MLEKALNASKNIILLRSRFMAIALCFALLLCFFALPASAAGFDYNDYVTNITVDGDNDIVTVVIPASEATVGIQQGTNLLAQNKRSLAISVSEGVSYNLFMWPFPEVLDLTNIPDGTTFSLGFECRVYSSFETPNMTLIYDYYSNGSYLSQWVSERGQVYINEVHYMDSVIQRPSPTANEMGASMWLYDLRPLNDTVLEFYAKDFVMTMSISSLYRLQQESGKTNTILKEVEKQLADQGKTLDEVLQQQQQTNDKLDDMQGSIETLPGQIGDEMQGIIDNEKEESKGEGNKFVDQILDALPDPSTDVLAALKGLTDATAYTGTDAVLPIPAIVLPGIEGLFPQTEIWGGTQFDFGEYIGMLPPALLTLVQSLFTIAIVLFCVYELKGIISYCLTLRESKGG